MNRAIRFSALLTALGGMSQPAIAADCPTKSDLRGGILVTQDDDYREIYQLSPDNPNIVTVEGYYDPNDTSLSLLSQGIYLVQSIDAQNGVLDPGTRQTYTYPLSPGDMPEPFPNGSWTAKIVVFSSDGIETETHVMRFLDQTTMTFGACSYDMVPVVVTYGEGEGETLYHLPELGFAVIGIWTSGGEDDVLTYTGIEVAK